MRRAAAVRACYGLVLLLSPRDVVERLSGADGKLFTVSRLLLGVRHLSQAFLLSNNDGRGRRFLSAGVDSIHAASMIPVIVFEKNYRRAASYSMVANLLLGIGDANEECPAPTKADRREA
ncbi:hypothetical protein [Haladaptatus sp. CMAA 1911]|uniref:hypothetical protein n=1 Tax=unclassified Haladaptatus TaxID=2622732 RepID=UPI0037544127